MTSRPLIYEIRENSRTLGMERLFSRYQHFIAIIINSRILKYKTRNSMLITSPPKKGSDIQRPSSERPTKIYQKSAILSTIPGVQPYTPTPLKRHIDDFRGVFLSFKSAIFLFFLDFDDFRLFLFWIKYPHFHQFFDGFKFNR